MPIADGPPQSSATIFIVDDDASLREALSSLFRSVGLQAKTYGSAAEFLQENRTSDRSGCLVIDVRLPGLSGLDFQAELAKSNIHVPIVFMSGHGDIPMTVRAMKAGAIDFLTKPFRDQDMLDAVQLGLERDHQRRIAEGAATRVKASFEELSEREREVMEFVTKGMLNKQIAAELGIAEITVKVHRSHVMHKMGAKSLVDLVHMAELLGMRGTPV
jgi:FixJ family two-component response regulator